MPSCVVKSCKNNSRTRNKSDGITFHRFPKHNEPWKRDWINIIRYFRAEKDWVPSSTSVICSSHFEDQDMYISKTGCRCVVSYAVPKKLMFRSPNAQEEKIQNDPNISSKSQWTQQVTEAVGTHYKQEASIELSGSPRPIIISLSQRPPIVAVVKTTLEYVILSRKKKQTKRQILVKNKKHMNTFV